jgi:CRISPR-associated protein Csb1
MSETAKTLTYDELKNAVAGHAAAIRCRTRLQPAAGSGTKVFPPTHAGGVYATEKRRLPVEGGPGETREADCVLLDSVQSQANRIEDALQDAIDRKLIRMPVLVVEFGDKVADVQRVTSLQAPHRAADAILRDSLLPTEKQKKKDGTPTDKAAPFPESTIGNALTNSSPTNATAMFQYCPHALVLGIWDSTGKKGGLGAKFARALVSEIVGIDASFGRRTGSRLDPLQVKSSAGPLYANDVERFGGIEWTLDPAKAVIDKRTKHPVLFSRGNVATGNPGDPAKANHSNIPPTFGKYVKGAEGVDPLTGGEARQGTIAAGGVTIAYAEHTAVLSLPQLRRLRFPIDGKLDPKIDDAARTVLAALALVGLTLSIERGADLRSRCLLFPEAALTFDLLATPGKPDAFTLTSADAIKLFESAVAEARKLGLPWESEPIVLKPSDELIALVTKSQQLAAAGDEGE